MECRFCRNEIQPGERFCPYCGGEQYAADAPRPVQGAAGTQQAGETQILTSDMAYYGYNPNAQYGQAVQTASNPNFDAEAPQGIPQGVNSQYAAEPQPGTGPQGMPAGQIFQEQPDEKQQTAPQNTGEAGKKRGKKWIIIGTASACLFAAAVAAVVLFLGNFGETGRVCYIKDNELFTADLSKAKPTGEKCEEDFYEDRDDVRLGTGSLVRESEDGRYLFFPTEWDGYSFDLYYRDMKKKKAESVKLDNSVSSYRVTPQKKVVYKKDNDALYVHDLKDKEKIAGDIGSFWVADDGTAVMWNEPDSEGTYTLYYQNLSKKGEKTKIDSYVSQSVYCTEDLATVIYKKDDNLYVVNQFKSSEKIASGVTYCISANVNGELLLYYQKEGNDLTASDFVRDDVESEYSKEVMDDLTEELKGKMSELYFYDYSKNLSELIDTDVVDIGSEDEGVIFYLKLEKELPV